MTTLIDCDINPDFLARDPSRDADYPNTVSIRCEIERNQFDVFRVTDDALTTDGWLKGRLVADGGVPETVRIMRGGMPHPDGRMVEGRDYFEIVPSQRVRRVGVVGDEPRPTGKARRLRVVVTKEED